MLGVMVGLDSKDSCAVTGFAGNYSPCSMFPSVDDMPKMHDILAGTDQKYSYVGAWFCW